MTRLEKAVIWKPILSQMEATSWAERMLKLPIMQNPIMAISTSRITLFSTVNWMCWIRKKHAHVTIRVSMKIHARSTLFCIFSYVSPSRMEPRMAAMFMPIGMQPSNYLKPDLSKYMGSHRRIPYRMALSMQSMININTTRGSFRICLQCRQMFDSFQSYSWTISFFVIS